MKKIILYIFAVSLTVASCSKQPLNSDSTYSEDYRFFLKGQIDGLPFEFNAGEEGYYMETDYRIEDGVAIMEGRLGRSEDPNRNAMLIRLRGREDFVPNLPFNASEHIAARDYAFRDATGYRAQVGKYQLTIFGDSNFIANTDFHGWTFPDGSSGHGPHVKKTIDLNSFGTYEVSLNTVISGNCQSEVKHYINLNHDCDGTFKMYFADPYTLKAEVIARVGAVDHVEWFLDQTPVTRNFQGEIDLTAVPGAEMISCHIFFDDGCVRRVDRSLSPNLQSPCITDFWYIKEKPTVLDPKQYSTIELEYYDENGKKYTSYYSDVVGDFKITSSTPFLHNDRSQNTMRFFLEADVILRNPDGSSLELKNGFGSFAVAHP